MNQTERLLKERQENEAFPNTKARFKSRQDKLIANDTENVHRLNARDSTGEYAYFFVHVPARKESSFLNALKEKDNVDLDDWGTVIAKEYGRKPSKKTIEQLNKRFGWQLSYDLVEDEYESN